MSDFVIEKNIPIPNPGTRGSGFPLREMEVGDSFVVPYSQVSSIYTLSKQLRPKKFLTRKLDAKTSRVWRTA